MIKIEEYNEKYISEISNIVIRNLLEINSKDYTLEETQEMAKKFDVKNLKKTLSNRKKVYIAINNDEIVGTAGIDLSWYNADEYWILTVFVKPEHHGKGIGNLLIKTIESYAIKSNIKKLVVPSSITAHKFYYKLGYKYKHNIEKTNDENMYIMEKYL